jgi:hypothetical protein
MTNRHILPNSLKIFHQNICGLKHRWNQLLVPSYPHFPHVLHIREHHMNKIQLYSTNIENCRTENYSLGAT